MVGGTDKQMSERNNEQTDGGTNKQIDKHVAVVFVVLVVSIMIVVEANITYRSFLRAQDCFFDGRM